MNEKSIRLSIYPYIHPRISSIHPVLSVSILSFIYSSIPFLTLRSINLSSYASIPLAFYPSIPWSALPHASHHVHLPTIHPLASAVHPYCFSTQMHGNPSMDHQNHDWSFWCLSSPGRTRSGPSPSLTRFKAASWTNDCSPVAWLRARHELMPTPKKPLGATVGASRSTACWGWNHCLVAFPAGGL